MRRPSLNHRLTRLILALSLLLSATPALSLSTDKDEPIEVEADTAELDDIKRISIYTGDVVVDQGSIHMTGDRMTVYHTEDDELDYLIMEGKPATYRQLPDDSEVYDEAEALTLEYYEIKNYVILIREALVIQDGLRFSGNGIEYDTELSQVKAYSKPATDTAAPADGETDRGDRVRITIKKKKDPGTEEDTPIEP